MKSLLIIIMVLIFSQGIAAESILDIYADEIIYDIEQENVLARGGVVITDDNLTVSADEVRFSGQKQVLEAIGNITLLQDGQELFGEHLIFYVEDGEGFLKQAGGKYDNILIKASQIHFKETSSEVVDGVLTFCELQNPCYEVSAREITIYPGEKLLARGVTVYIKGVPVFYLPYYNTSLDGSGVTNSPLPEVGYDTLRGMNISFGQVFFPYEGGQVLLRGGYSSRLGFGYKIKGTHFFSKDTFIGGWTMYGLNEAIHVSGMFFDWKREGNDLSLGLEASSLSDITGSLNYKYTFDEEYLFSVELYNHIDLIPQGHISLSRSETESEWEVKAAKRIINGETVSFLPGISYTRSLSSMVEGLDIHFRGEKIHHHEEGISDWRVGAGYTFETEDYNISRNLNISSGIGTMLYTYGTGDISSHIMFALGIEGKMGEYIDYDVGYLVDYLGGSTRFDFANTGTDQKIEGSMVLNMGNVRIKTGGKYHIETGLSDIKYEILVDLHCFEAGLSWKTKSNEISLHVVLAEF